MNFFHGAIEGENGAGRGACRGCGREGAALVLVICAAAVLLALSLGAAALAAGRARRAADALVRIELRDAARAAVFGTAEMLCADTNGVDHLGEDWALASAEAAKALGRGGDGVFVTVEDECARVGFPACGKETLASLVAAVSGVDAALARGEAEAAFLWKERRDAESTLAGATNAVLAAEEELLDVPVADPAGFAKSLPFLTVLADDGRINANTAPREAVVACILGAGGTPDGAEGVWTRLEMVRGRGGVFETTEQGEALKLLRGEGDVPAPAELAALQLLRPRLRVDTDLFRLAAVARRGPVRVRVECVWDRAARRILRWVE